MRGVFRFTEILIFEKTLHITQSPINKGVGCGVTQSKPMLWSE